MVLSTPAIVLKAIDFQESSRIVTLLTPDHGKIAVLARGARKPKSKFAGIFEPGTILDAVIYTKPSRSVQNITEAGFRQRNWSLRNDFNRLAVVMATVEMLDQLVHDNESSRDFFEMTEKLLSWLNETDVEMGLIFPYIMIRLAEISGIGIQSARTSVKYISGAQSELGKPEPRANQSDTPWYLNIEDGLVSTDSGHGLSFKLTHAQSVYILSAVSGKKSAIFRNPIPRSELKLLIHHLDVYFRHHIDGMRDRRSDAIFDQILPDF